MQFNVSYISVQLFYEIKKNQWPLINADSREVNSCLFSC